MADFPSAIFPCDAMILMLQPGSAVGGAMWGMYRAIQLLSAPYTLHGVQIV